MDSVERAVEVLRGGGLVAFPTETVYGLGADATSSEAVARLFTAKGRPADHPVIVHLADGADLDRWAERVTDVAQRLGRQFWPGPLTVIVPRREHRIVDAVTGGRATVAIRVPDHPVALELLRSFGGPVAAPSANRFGRVSPTTADDAVADLGDGLDAVLDGGPCAVGVESTIVDGTVDPPVVRRVGGVPLEEIETILGIDVAVDDRGGGAPGTLRSHYAPRASVVIAPLERVGALAERLLATGERVGVLGLAVTPPAGVVDLGVRGDVDEYARLLYTRLREADRRRLDTVIAVAPPASGRGAAVVDRLRRASASR